MSTITPYPEAKGSAVKVVWTEPKANVVGVSAERVHHSDAEMMYAWSIGVTEVAREMAVERHEKECPPEVYIG